MMRRPLAFAKEHASLCLFIFFAGLYLLTAGGHFYNQDGYFKYLTLDQIFRGEGPFHPRFFTPGLGGRMTTSFPPGTSVWMLPLYLAGKAVMALALSWNPAAAIDPALFFAPLFVTFLNVFFSAGLCALFFAGVFQMSRSFSGSMGMTLCLGLGTLVWPYSKFCYSEPQAAFFLWAAFLALYRLKQQGGHPSLPVFWLCCAVLTKYETIFLWPAFAAYGFYGLKKSQATVRARDLIFASTPPLLLTAGLLILWSYWRTGHGWTFGHYGGYLFSNPWGWGTAMAVLSGAALYLWKQPAAPKIHWGIKFLAAAGLGFYLWAIPAARREVVAVLFAPGKSLFVFSPLLIMAAAGYPAFHKRFRAEALFTAALFFSYLLFLPPTLQSAAWQWGPRCFVSLIPFLFLPACVFFDGASESLMRRGLKTGVIALSFGVQILAVSASYLDTFNYTAQRVSDDLNQPLADFEIERKVVFPRMIEDWAYAPLAMQSIVFRAVLTGKIPPAPREPLAFKTNVKKPQDWKWDFWWVYLWR